MVEICSIDYTKQDERNLRMKGNSRDLNGTSKIFWTSERDMQFQKYFKIFFVCSFVRRLATCASFSPTTSALRAHFIRHSRGNGNGNRELTIKVKRRAASR